MVADDSNDDRTKSFVALTAGTKVLHYKIISKLGAGGMGEVYLAKDTELDRKVALKFLPPHLCQEEYCRTRFKREAQAAAKLDHPNIVTIHEVSEFQGRPFFAMQHVEGQSLRNLIKEKELTLERVIELSIQVCEGLGKAHQAGIIHRDLKPSNIVIDADGRPKLLDFGLAAVQGTDKLTMTGSTLGTIGYMSPEQAHGRKVDQRSDLFSLGVVLYELITGRRPFKGEDDAATLHAITHDTPEPLKRYKADVPDELQRIVDKALQKNVETRYQHVDDFRVDLKQVTGEMDSAGLRVSTPPVRRRLRLYSVFAALIVLAVLLWWVDRSDRLDLVPTEKHLVVLPFANLGDGLTTEAFCNGFMETLSSELTQMQQFHGMLWVVPASEVRQQGVSSASQARRTFGINLAISGSIQQLGQAVRITLNLVDAKSERQLRSSVIDHSLDDLTALQDLAVMTIADMLEVHLQPEEKEVLQADGTDVPEAYDLYLRGRGYLQYPEKLGNIDTAIELLQQALDHDPDYVLALSGLGEAYWEKYRVETDPQWSELAVYNSRRALDVNDQVAPVYVTLGLIYNGTGRYEQAVKEFNQALSLDSTSSAAYLGLALALESLNMLDTAEAVYNKAIAIRPHHWSGYANLGFFYAFHGRYDDALVQLDRAEALEHEGFDAWNNLGGLCYFIGETDRAREMWERSVEIDPNYAALSNLGAAHFMNGNFAEAALRYGEALRLNDYDYRIWINLASALDNLPGKDERSRETFAKGIELAEVQRQINPRDPGLLADLAGAYASVGDSSKAVSLANEVLDLAPENVEMMVNAGHVFEQIGDRDKALSLIVEALKRGFPRNQIKALPELRELVNDPRFDSLVLKSSADP